MIYSAELSSEVSATTSQPASTPLRTQPALSPEIVVQFDRLNINRCAAPDYKFT